MQRTTHPISSSLMPPAPVIAQSTAITLTKREQQVLHWVAQGKSSWEIGHIIQCQECTVNFHCRNIMLKLDVNTRGHALIKAVGLGLLEP